MAIATRLHSNGSLFVNGTIDEVSLSNIRTVFLTTLGRGEYIIPSDFVNLISIEGIGTGGGNVDTGWLTGGGGGAYAKSTSIKGLIPGQTLYYNIGVQSSSLNRVNVSQTWINTTNTVPTNSSTGILADGGVIQYGGLADNSVGDVKYSGGNANLNFIGATNRASGGGGAGGPHGPGGIGANNASVAGGGGGSNGGLDADAGTGGAGQGNGYRLGIGVNTGAGGNVMANGQNGSIWTQTSDGQIAGPGGGGGGATTGAGRYGGLYGGGSGGRASGITGSGLQKGGQGIIVITYFSNTANASTVKERVVSNFDGTKYIVYGGIDEYTNSGSSSQKVLLANGVVRISGKFDEYSFNLDNSLNMLGITSTSINNGTATMSLSFLSDGTCTTDSGGNGTWYDTTANGSNFEIQTAYTSNFSLSSPPPLSMSFFGESITVGQKTNWYTLNSTRTINGTLFDLSDSATFTVYIRQKLIHSNIKSAEFTFQRTSGGPPPP